MKPNKLKRVKGDRYYGKVASEYEAIRSQQPWWQVEQEEMKSLLDLLPRELSVLDAPFGTGRFVPYYLERGYSVFGLDASDEMMATAERILGDDYTKCHTRRGLSTDLPFEDGQFDLVVSTRFLRDIIVFKDVKKTLAEFARVTRRYAILQLGIKRTEPFETPQDDEKMGSRMSREQTSDLLQQYGFEVNEFRKVKRAQKDASAIYHVLCKKAHE